jgi:hypothetical protein
MRDQPQVTVRFSAIPASYAGGIAAALPLGPYNQPLALIPHPRLGINERIGAGSYR